MRFVDAVTWARAFSPTDTRPVGFSLIAAGALCGLVGVGAVLFAQTAPGMQKYAYREIAGAALGLALPLFLAGVAMSLPMRHAAQAALGSGVLFCLVAVGLFVHLYPFDWNVRGRDSSPRVIIAYGLGLAYIVGALSTALVDAYVEMRTRRAEARAEEEEVTDEEVMRDLLETTSRMRLTWGGLRTDDRELNLTPVSTTHLTGALDRVGIRSTVPGEGLMGDVGALLAFRGHRDPAHEEYDDSNVNALAAMRAQREAARPKTFLQRLALWWRGPIP